MSQSVLDAWASQGRVDVDASSITLLSGEGRGRRYALEPAARFLRVAGGGEDPNQLVARVKTLTQVRELGGDALADSVVLGEVAYEVEPGFLAESGAVEAAAKGMPPDLEDRRKEAEALARFLLDNLS